MVTIGRKARLGVCLTSLLGVWGCGAEDLAPGGEPVANTKLAQAPGSAAIAAPGGAPAVVVKVDPDGPKLGAVQMKLSIYSQPDPRSKKLGYLRVGQRVARSPEAVKFDSCQGGWFAIHPSGFVCLDDGGTTDMQHPLMRAGIRPARHDRPLPYDYAFVRAIAPRYYRVPTRKEQFKYEMSLKRHLRSFERLHEKWNRIEVGSNDVPMEVSGLVMGTPPKSPPELSENAKFGGEDDDSVPWYFEDGRGIPNIANFKVPDYAVMTNRIKRHAGVAVVKAFRAEERRFAVTTDLRLIPTSKLKPERGATFHGVELGDNFELPVAFVKRDGVHRYERRTYKRRERLARGTPVQLTGNVKRKGKRRWVEAEDGTWLRTRDLAIAVKTSKLPRHARGDTKWIDVSIQRQTLVLFEGKTPVFVTMVSTGKDGLGDPRKTHSTPRGTFRIRDKHVTATMDSDVVGSAFELADVPYVQYFKAGFAIHAAYWHTEYGRARSHGCINLAPIDAYRVFQWTGPHLPEKWHGVAAGESTGKGTLIHIHP